VKKLAAVLCTLIILLASLAGCAPEVAPSNGSPATVRDDLKIILNNKIPNYDPFSGTLVESDWLNSLLFERLVDNKDTDTALELVLAKEYTISEDGLTWTFILRDNVTFHDGAKLTSEDVKFSLETAMGKAQNRARMSIIDSVEAKDALTVEVKAKRYDADMLEVMASFWVVPAAKYTELGSEGFAKVLIGTGPFKLKSIDAATGNIELERNDDYWGTPSKLKTINFRLITDPTARLVALEKGEVDFNRIYTSDYPTVSASPRLAVEWVPSLTFSFLCFNTQQAPCDNKLFRQAVAYAIDYESLNMVATGGHGSEPSSILYKDMYGFKADGVKEYTYSPEKAKELLREAGIQTPLNLGPVYTPAAQKNVIEQLQQNLRAVGIEINIEVVEAAVYVNNLISGNYKIAYMPGMSGSLSPTTFYKTILSKEALGGGYNFARYTNDEIEELLEQLSLRRDDSQTVSHIHRILEIVQEDLPYLNLYHSSDLCAYDKNLQISKGISRYYFADFYWKQ